MNANVCIGNSGFFTCHMFQTQYESFEIHSWILVKKLIFLILWLMEEVLNDLGCSNILMLHRPLSTALLRYPRHGAFGRKFRCQIFWHHRRQSPVDSGCVMDDASRWMTDAWMD